MTWTKTAFTDRLGIEFPIVQAPMGGGISTPALAAAVSQAGGFGSLALSYVAPEAIAGEVAAVRSLTNRPFAANLFVYEPGTPTAEQLHRARDLLAPIRSDLGLAGEPDGPPPVRYNVDDQIAAVLDAGPAVFSFTFGVPKAGVLAECRRRGILTMGTATSLAEGLALADAGVDMIIAQGSEAGGHRGTFLHDFEEGMVGTFALTRQIATRVDRPVVAAGGIMDGRGIAAALTLGASAAALGTAFMLSPEAGTNAPHRRMLKSPQAANTAVTRAFSGRPARAIVNDQIRAARPMERDLPPFPVMIELTRDIRAAAIRLDRPDYIPLWAGQGAALARELPAAELLRALAAEVGAVLPA